MLDPLRVPGYEVHGLAGRGAAGDVWVATEQASGRRVALKRLRGAGEAERQSLAREGALQSAVRHPHLLATHGVLETPAGLVLVLELAEGGSLRELLERRGPLDAGEVVTVAAPVAQALAACHEAGLVHGDVSPGNVLLTADGRPLLGDLGVARVAGARASGRGATTAYAAPEVRAGEAPVPASDVFALASVALAAYTGRPPAGAWDAATAGRLAALPEQSRDVLDRAAAPRPERRPDAAELADALYGLASPTPVRLELSGRPLRAAEPAGAGDPDGELTSPAPGSGPTATGLTGPPAHHGRGGPGVPASPPAHRRPPAPGPASASGRGARGGRRLPRAARRVAGWHVTAALMAVAAVVWGVVAVGIVHDRHRPAAQDAERSAALTDASVAGSAPSTTAPPCWAARAVPSVAPAPGPDAVDWASVVGRLAAERSRAFAGLDAAALCRVYAPGSPGLAEDLGTMAAYAAEGLRPRGLSVRLVSVRPLGREGPAVLLAVTDSMPAYEVVDPQGVVRQREPALATRTWRAAVVRLADGWRWR